MSKTFYIILTLIFLLNLAGPALAQRGLEVDYPTIPGTNLVPRVVEETSLPDYVKYIFNFAVWIIGFLAFASVIYGGIRYLTSAGDPSKADDAKKQIFAGIIGLVILFSSWMILNTIDPQLVIFEVPELTTATTTAGAGVWVCKSADVSPESCYSISTSQTLQEGFDNEVSYVYLGESGTTKYGAIIYENSDFTGNCQVVTESRSISSGGSSVTPLILNSSASGPGITLYSKPDLDGSGTVIGPIGVGTSGGMDPAYSIKFDLNTKQYIAILFGRGLDFANWQNSSGWCQVFDQTDRNLEDDYVSYFCGTWFNRHPCVGSVRVLSGQVLGIPH